MQFMAGILVVCKTTLYNIIQYKTLDLKKDLELFIWFKNDHIIDILYKII